MTLPVPLKVFGGSGGGHADVANEISIGFTPIGGETSSTDWDGTAVDLYNEYQVQKALASGSAPWWDVCKLTFGKGRAAHLHCESVGDGMKFWELLPNEYRPPVEQHHYFQAGTYVCIGGDLMAVKWAHINGWQITVGNKIPLPAVQSDGSIASSMVTVTAGMAKLMAYYLSGVTEYPCAGWVLRSTFKGSLRSTSNITTAGINTVVTPPSGATAQAMIGQLAAGEWLYKGGSVTGYQLGRLDQVEEWWWIANPPGWPKFLGGSFDPS